MPSRAWPHLLLALALFGVGIAAWRPVPAGVWHDDGVYMLVGKAIAEGHGLTYHGVVGAPPAVKFPPLYPAVLSLLWLVLPGIGAVTLVAVFLNLALLAAAGALLARALHATAGLSLRTSALVAGLGFISTDLLRTALVPLSESLFVFLTAAALAVWESASREGERRALVGLALLLLVAVATRSAGVAVAAGFAVALALRRGPAVAAAVSGPALVFTFLWGRWAAARTLAIPEGTRDLLGPYGTWLLDQVVTAPGAFVTALPPHALGVFERMAAIFFPRLEGWPLLVAGVAAAPIALHGLVRLARRFPPVAWTVLAYVAMLLVWPYLDRRLVAPIHPLVMACVAVGGIDLLDRLRAPRLRTLVVGAGVVWAAAYTVVGAARIAEGWPAAAYRLRAERLATAVEALGRTAPADAIVGAPEFWAALHLHGGWTVAPSTRFDPRSVDPEAPMWGTPEEQIALWREAGIDHLLLEQAGRLHGAALDRLEAECPGSAFVLAQMENMLIVRLVRDAPCDGG